MRHDYGESSSRAGGRAGSQPVSQSKHFVAPWPASRKRLGVFTSFRLTGLPSLPPSGIVGNTSRTSPPWQPHRKPAIPSSSSGRSVSRTTSIGTNMGMILRLLPAYSACFCLRRWWSGLFDDSMTTSSFFFLPNSQWCSIANRTEVNLAELNRRVRGKGKLGQVPLGHVKRAIHIDGYGYCSCTTPPDAMQCPVNFWNSPLWKTNLLAKPCPLLFSTSPLPSSPDQNYAMIIIINWQEPIHNWLGWAWWAITSDFPFHPQTMCWDPSQDHPPKSCRCWSVDGRHQVGWSWQ